MVSNPRGQQVRNPTGAQLRWGSDRWVISQPFIDIRIRPFEEGPWPPDHPRHRPEIRVFNPHMVLAMIEHANQLIRIENPYLILSLMASCTIFKSGVANGKTC